MTGRLGVSDLVVYGTLAVFGFFALAGVLLISPGAESTQRLGLLFGIIGTAVATLVAAIRSDQAAGRLNGELDARIQAAVHRANDARRVGDRPATINDEGKIVSPVPATTPDPAHIP
jgi:hypothetical protein